MPKTFSSVWVHTIWTTKERNPLLNQTFRAELCTFIRKNTRKKEILVDMINGVEDHLHCLFRLLPRQSISEVMKQIKGASSFWINDNNLTPIKFKWQEGFGALSVSPGEIDKVRSYIKNQKQHHKKWHLDDELKRFLYFSPNE